jgi:hypothetical protein
MKPAMVFCRPRLEIKPIEGFLGGHHAIDQKRSILTFDHVGLFALNLGTDRLARDRLEQSVWVTVPSRLPYSLTIVAKRTGAFLNCSRALKILIPS